MFGHQWESVALVCFFLVCPALLALVGQWWVQLLHQCWENTFRSAVQLRKSVRKKKNKNIKGRAPWVRVAAFFFHFRILLPPGLLLSYTCSGFSGPALWGPTWLLDFTTWQHHTFLNHFFVGGRKVVHTVYKTSMKSKVNNRKSPSRRCTFMVQDVGAGTQSAVVFAVCLSAALWQRHRWRDAMQTVRSVWCVWALSWCYHTVTVY